MATGRRIKVASMSPAPTPKNVLGLLGAFTVTSLVAGVLAAGLAVPAIGATGLASNSAIDAFNALPSELENTQVSASTRVLASDGSLIATFYDENRDPVELDQISKYMQDAVVAIEDERFYEHGGVDTKGLLRALVANQVSGGVSQGASTLTQQLVKNTLKDTAHAAGDAEAYEAAEEQTNSRKLREIRLATALEKKMSKQEILEGYLNIAWFGGQTNGVEAAAKYYFGTSAKKLTLPQAAMLAGMIQSPPQYNIAKKEQQEKALNRRNTVLAKMLQQGKITQAEHDEAVDTPLKPNITPTYQGCANAGVRAYFCDYVYNVITKGNGFKALGKTVEDREAALKRGGYTIRTTLDPKILKAGWKAVKDAIPPNDSSNVATASVTVEPGTGKVLSMIQNKYYSTKKGRKNTTINYSTDYKYGGSSGFLTGSTFKPVVLATWLKAGHSLNASINGSAGSVPVNSFKSCGSNLQSSEIWNFQNSSGESGNGNMSVWDATANSVNGAYIRMEQQLDLCDVREMAEALGMHQAAPVEVGGKKTTKLPDTIPSIVLGTINQSPLTMANAYATFASGGKYCTPIVVTSIKDRNGKKVKIPKTNCKQTVDPEVANTTTLGLSRALINGTARSTGPLSSGQKASGKTGTTNDSMDTWFVGYTPQLSTSVWVGPEFVNGKRENMQGITIGGSYYGNVYGGTFAAPIWKDIMEKALEARRSRTSRRPTAACSRPRCPTSRAWSARARKRPAASWSRPASPSSRAISRRRPTSRPAPSPAPTPPAGPAPAAPSPST